MAIMSLLANNFIVLKANKPTVKKWRHSYVALFRMSDGCAVIYADKVKLSRRWMVDIALPHSISRCAEGNIKKVVMDHINSFYNNAVFDFGFHINPRTK